MASIRVHDKNFTPYLSETQIQEKINLLAAQLNKDYAGKKPLFIAILNGSFILAADLFKKLQLDAEICFVKLASYKGTKSTGHIITATGKTLNQFLPQLYNLQPLSLRIAVLLHKPEATIYPIKIDYCCFTLPDKFVVGYGLDYDGLGRNLKGIYQLLQD